MCLLVEVKFLMPVEVCLMDGVGSYWFLLLLRLLLVLVTLPLPVRHHIATLIISYIHEIFECSVCACVCVCVCVCMRARVHACVCMIACISKH